MFDTKPIKPFIYLLHEKHKHKIFEILWAKFLYVSKINIAVSKLLPKCPMFMIQNKSKTK